MGVPVLGTSRTAEKLERLKSLGLDHGIGGSGADFVANVHELTAGEGVSVVIDLLGGSVLAGNLGVLAPQGRLVLVGLLAECQRRIST